MSAKLGTLTVDLLAKVGSFITDMKRAEKTAKTTGGRIRDVMKKVGPSVAAGLAAGAAGAAAAGAMIASVIKEADQMEMLSQKIGISTEAISRLGLAAKLSDVSMQDLQQGLARLARAQNEAATGSGAMADLFRVLQVDATNADKSLRDSEAVMRDLADVFQALPEGPERAALALQVFGRAGVNLIPMLMDGSAGLAAFAEQSDRIGHTLTNEAGAAAEQFGDNMLLANEYVRGLARAVAIELLPDLLRLTDGFGDTDSKAKELAGTVRGLVGFLGGVADVASIVKSTVEGVVFASIQLFNSFQALGNLADPFGPIREWLGGESNIERARRNLREGQVAGGMAGDSFGRAGAIIHGTDVRHVAPPAVEFITPDNLGDPRNRVPTGSGRDSEDLVRRLAEFRGEAERAAAATKAQAGATRAAALADRERAQALKDSDAAAESMRQAQADFTAALQDYQATIDGPLAQSELQWQRRQDAYREQQAQGSITLDQLNAALAVTTELRRRDAEAIMAQGIPGERLIESLREELRLLGMTNLEREIANTLRHEGIDAMSDEADEAERLIREIADTRDRLRFSADIRRGFEDTFAAIIDGSKSARDALASLGSYITSLIAQRLSERLVDSLFGPPGTPLGGNASDGIGGLLSRAIGALFGGGRAAGGWVGPGKLYEVGESGPETLRLGNRQFLIPPASGMVTPGAPGGGGGVVQHITVQGTLSPRTASQLAAEAARAQRRVTARMGA